MSDLNIFDLDLAANAEEGAAMTLKHPITGEDATFNGKPIRIFLKGNDSTAFKNRLDFHRRKSGRNDRKEPTIAEMEEQSADLLSVVTIGWENVPWEGGELLEFSRENAKMLYKKRPWVRRQVDEFVAEAENFIKSSSSN